MPDANQGEWPAEFIAIVEDEINNADRENWENREARYASRVAALKPLFVDQPQLERICENLNNAFVKSGFTKYIFSSEDYNESIHEESTDLEYLINICGSKLVNLNAYGFTNSQIMHLIKNNCSNLQQLTLCFTEMNDDDFLNVFDNIRNLEKLSIFWGCENSTLPMTLVESLEQLVGSLKNLRLNRTHADVIFLPDSLALIFSQLLVNYLYIRDFGLSQTIINSISGMRNLTHINIKFFKLDSHPLFDININMYPIGNLTNLEILELHCDNGITDEFLINLCNNSKELKHLDIIGANITNKGMMALNNLKQLTMIDLGLTKFRFETMNILITDESIISIKNQKLHTIDLSNCKMVTNKSVIKLIEDLPNLRAFHVKNTKVNYELTHLLSLIDIKDREVSVYVSFKDFYKNIANLEKSHNITIVPENEFGLSTEVESEHEDDESSNEVESEYEDDNSNAHPNEEE